MGLQEILLIKYQKKTSRLKTYLHWLCIKYPSNDRVQKFLFIVISYDSYVLNQTQ